MKSWKAVLIAITSIILILVIVQLIFGYDIVQRIQDFINEIVE